MAQPWPTIGGNVISAFVGIFIGHTIAEPALAAGVAVGVAIALMSLLRCLHPPGGAAALVAVFAAPSAGYLFPLVPIGLNAVLLVACAFAYHRALGRAYPHVPAKTAVATGAPSTFDEKDIEGALLELGEAFDISTSDLERLLREIEKLALARSCRDFTCADIMTVDVIAIGDDASFHQARSMLAECDFRTLPVIDAEGSVVGVIGQRQLERHGNTARELMSKPATAVAATPALALIDKFSRDRVHAVYVLDETGKPIGVVTEADWLAVLTRGAQCGGRGYASGIAAAEFDVARKPHKRALMGDQLLSGPRPSPRESKRLMEARCTDHRFSVLPANALTGMVSYVARSQDFSL